MNIPEKYIIGTCIYNLFRTLYYTDNLQANTKIYDKNNDYKYEKKNVLLIDKCIFAFGSAFVAPVFFPLMLYNDLYKLELYKKNRLNEIKKPESFFDILYY